MYIFVSWFYFFTTYPKKWGVKIDITELESKIDELETLLDDSENRVEELESRLDDFTERYEVEELESRIDIIEAQLEFFLKGVGKIFTSNDFSAYIQEENNDRS